ncbi:hypothetical protein A3F58_01375 [Candidatus Roizmanbacteria bacterium RIFCSPHIGHO2_12_FULL_37_9b]|uniref:RNase H type-1 domain-containing protein n=1 Tax=Candidatus Roizmanbacteria bacterium RIFCSPHIGHO2_02_FULL_38_11 TaxID=1802039 RepID=A0A1F7GYE4_9BACT|nr:MAG: hypothetical protein A3C25_05090 [Candidatus Roizmanbacteria bacterium RIFCSPHIGHO2_02_FULL_38_11]OGK35263.1 MAG: hypothetical protein A3F58_01375 [Candidatus Roizmanbacteria bacterium RIFCSPHIGHO2_12_FULL_37_9b]
MELKIYTDGGSINNPGPAAIAFVIYQDSHIFHQHSSRIGVNTNNFAEYSALVRALEWVKKNSLANILNITIFSDSNLMINQLNGLYKVKNAVIREFILKIIILEQEIKTPIFYRYVPREKNRLADSLVKKELRNF